MFIRYLFDKPDLYMMWMTIVIFSICCHEYLHARAALWQGDSTAANAGHLTLNPLRQMGVFSLILCAVIGIAWGAVPVNPNAMKHKYSDALVSFAGPFANFLLFLLGSFLAALALQFQWTEGAKQFFKFFALINCVLFIFNMLPIPMLDGGKVLGYLFPLKLNLKNETKNVLMVIIVLGLFMGGFRFIWMAGAFISNLSISNTHDLLNSVLGG